MNIFVLILILLMVVSAVIAVRARNRNLHVQLYVFKPLAMVFILLIAIVVRKPDFSLYFYLIMTGLVCCLVGDVFLMFTEKWFQAGLISFLIGHVVYLAAFTSGIGFGFSWWLILPFVFYGVIMLRILWPHLGKMRLPVLIYIAVIVVMVWQAWERYHRMGQSSPLLASIGAVLFLISDSILALNKFRKRLNYAHAYILSTYFCAQCLIGLSVGQ